MRRPPCFLWEDRAEENAGTKHLKQLLDVERLFILSRLSANFPQKFRHPYAIFGHPFYILSGYLRTLWNFPPLHATQIPLRHNLHTDRLAATAVVDGA
jgi:hypothetical protein